MRPRNARATFFSASLRTSIVTAHAIAFIGCSAGVEDRDAGPDFGGSGSPGDDGGSTSMEPADDTTGSPGSTADAGMDSGDGDGDDDGDDAADSGGPPPPTIRCDKIDFLIVIESAWSQDPEQLIYYDSYSKLREGFESLVSSLYVSVDVDDFRVLVTASTPASGELSCAPKMNDGCPPGGGTDACDLELGAGRNGFSIPDWGVTECMTGRFLESGHPDIAAAFGCLVDWWGGLDGWGYYSAGGEDRLMDAMVLAVGDEAEPGQCNEGFLRDDALLVVLLLEQGGDLQPDVSSGTIESWHAALVEAKHGNEENVVVLGLGPDGDAEQPLCSPSESDAFGGKLRELVESFPNGKWASSCLPDYVPYFGVAAEMIDAACEEFTPAG